MHGDETVLHDVFSCGHIPDEHGGLADQRAVVHAVDRGNDRIAPARCGPDRTQRGIGGQAVGNTSGTPGDCVPAICGHADVARLWAPEGARLDEALKPAATLLWPM